MKFILFCMTLGLAPAVAQCDEYRFFELLVPKDAMSDEEREDPEFLLAEIGQGVVILKSYASVRKNSDTPLALDRTYTVRFPEGLGSAGRQESHMERKVGLEIRVTEGDGDRAKVEYENSKIERWIPFGDDRETLVPMFGTFRLTGDLNFSATDFLVRGGLQRDSDHRVLVIQRIVQPGDHGNTGKPSGDERTR